LPRPWKSLPTNNKMRQQIHVCLWVRSLWLVMLLLSITVHGFTPPIDQGRWNLKIHLDVRPSGGTGGANSPDHHEQQLVQSRLPHQLANGRGTFLGFRNARDVPGLKSSVGALMPDGGLSPCVIRVLGVGGGGCNAVRIWLLISFLQKKSARLCARECVVAYRVHLHTYSLKWIVFATRRCGVTLSLIP
jgi:hypothetical protein